MWKSEQNPHFSADGDDARMGGMDYDDSADVGVFSRARGAATTMDDLRNQGGFGVIVAASDMKQPTHSIGSRFTSELDSLSRREGQVREMQELATHRVLDLTTEQLRQILEFMM